MRSLTTVEAGASAMQFAGQSVTSHIRWFRSLKEAAVRTTYGKSATLIADDWQLASPYSVRPAASFKERSLPVVVRD